jgi:hypothetical protein
MLSLLSWCYLALCLLRVYSRRKRRRRTKRLWDKVPSFAVCAVIVDIEGLPNTAIDVFVKVNEDLMLQYNLDMFQRWRLYPIVMVDGFPFRDSFCNVGMASDEWMEDYFNDERFEGLNSYA